MDPRVIVCPMELSPTALAAFDHAVALARWHDAEVHVLFVRPERGFGGMLTGGTVDPLWRRLHAFVDARAEYVTAQREIEGADVTRRVLDYAREQDADLIVTGRHVRGRRSAWSAGFSQEIASTAHCPTLVVSNALAEVMPPAVSYQNLLCGVDFTPSSAAALERALFLAQQSGGRLTLLHVIEGYPAESVYSGSRAFRLVDDFGSVVLRAEHRVRALVPQDALDWCDVDVEIVSGVPDAAITAAAVERNADVVIIGATRRSALERLLTRSTMSAVLRQARWPVLTVPPAGAAVSETVAPIEALWQREGRRDMAPAREA